MGRILALDFGTKRTGIAVTDPLKIIATALGTFSTSEVVEKVFDYTRKEPVELIVVGLPKQMNGQPSETEAPIQSFIKKLQNKLPEIPIARYDERYTTQMAIKSLIESGVKKKQRQDKNRLDSVSATLILQSYLLSVQ